MIPQQSYSPDFDPCDFILFPKKKKTMERKRLTTIEEIKTKSLKELNDIPKSMFQKGLEDWNKQWHKYVRYKLF